MLHQQRGWVRLNHNFMIHTETNAPKKMAVKISEAAAMLGVCENSVRRLIARGKLRAVRVLRHVLVPVSEIERLLSE